MLIQTLSEFLMLILGFINLGLTIGIIAATIRILISLAAPNISLESYTFTRILYKLTEPTLSRARRWAPINYNGIDLYKLTEPTLSRARRWMPINYNGVDFSPIIVIFTAIFAQIFVIRGLVILISYIV
jgi:uncharacterized protein YggT (Ycf19 family)